MKLLDYFANGELALDYNWDEEEEDFVNSSFLDLAEDDEVLEEIEEGANDRMRDNLSFNDIKDEAHFGQFLSRLFDEKEISEEEGADTFKRYKAIYEDDDKRDDIYDQIQVNTLDFEKSDIDNAIRDFFSVKKEEGDLYGITNGIPLFVIDSIVMAIIENTVGEYEGELHFDIGGGSLDAVIPVKIVFWRP